jgi:hypothetical protein
MMFAPVPLKCRRYDHPQCRAGLNAASNVPVLSANREPVAAAMPKRDERTSSVPGVTEPEPQRQPERRRRFSETHYHPGVNVIRTGSARAAGLVTRNITPPFHAGRFETSHMLPSKPRSPDGDTRERPQRLVAQFPRGAAHGRSGAAPLLPGACTVSTVEYHSAVRNAAT